MRRKSHLHPFLPLTQRESRIQLMEHILILVFCLSFILSNNLKVGSFRIPLTASCFPLVLVLGVRFLFHKSVLKAFKSPVNFLKFIFQFLALNLILNFSLKADDYYSFDAIAFLWPCYGYIAITFIFFIGSFLLFIGAACNSFNSLED